ncbi:MAG: class I SAM-dependent methyltransferase [Anaerolineae bacterium]|nr:class I SAM-dependent methyltransferase [Anaerolineae bacterium]
MADPAHNEIPRVIDYEGSDYQTSFWDQGGRAYEDQTEAIALRRLLPSGGSLMLEIGAGAGRNTPRYQGYQRVVVMDYSVTQLQQAQKRLGRSSRYIYVAADVYRLPFVSGLFDGVTMIRVLHHIEDVPRALAVIRDAVQTGGIFILEYANKRNLKAILRFWLGRQKWNPFTREQVEFVELNFNFHPKTVREDLKRASFKLERQLTLSHFRVGLLKRVVPTKILVWLDALFQLTGGLWQYSPSVFTRSQAVGDPVGVEAGAFFRCPHCGDRLEEKPGQDFLDSSCGKRWAVQDGIYNFKEPVN